ncbi:MAG: glycosyltransferase family 4 protein [Myxococcota bacterium]
MRVALLTNVLTPYRLPVYRDLAATPGLDLRLLVTADTELHWREMFVDAFAEGRQDLAVERVRGLTVQRRVKVHRASDTHHRVALHLPLGVFGALRRARPDVIVSSELGLRTLLAAAWAALFGVPLVVWTYASRAFHDASTPLQRARRRLLLRRADAVVGMGRQAREGLLDLGVPDDRIFDAPNAHDAERFERALARVDRDAARLALRARLGLRENVALVAGRLVAQKGIDRLLAAWDAVPADARADWSLVFVGDGPEAGRVQRAAATRPGEFAHVPALPPSGMPDLYSGADLLVFPSLGDAWGLVVNEALVCGVPVLCSSLAGCADDLIEPGRTGWRFDPTDAETAPVALEAALRSDALPRMGALGRDVAKRCSPEAMAAGLRRAVAHAAARRRSAVR